MHTHSQRLAMMHQRAAEREMSRRGLASGARPRRMYGKRRHPYGRGRGRRGGRTANQGPCSVKEKKFHDIQFSSDGLGTANSVLSHTVGTTFSWLLIAQGLTEVTRIGRRICVKGINLKGMLKLALGESAITGNQVARLWLILDTQANGAIPAAAEIFEQSAGGIFSYRNLANQERFQVLWTKQFIFNAQMAGNGTALDTAETVKTFAMSKKTNFVVQYDAGAGVIAELQTNNIFLMGCTQNSLVTEITARARIRFTD